ncbi:MAG: AcrB/AcrD/AcrF family protein [Bacteroidetes bacterium]|nr:MAG: AcrB/AcrD/AcrF family protein [Bacteroidota bacterium]
MRLPELAIDNRSFTWMVFIFLTVVGVRSFVNMPRTENPEVTVPGSSIIVLMPGAGPMDLESLVALPLEEAMNELDDIKQIITDIRDGIAVISVEFEFNTDADEKYDEVVQQVNSVRDELPDEILQLETWQWSISDMSMLLLALISEDAPYNEMEQVSDELSKRIEKIRSVRKVSTYALPDQEVHIYLDFEKMAMVNTTLDHVTRAIVSNNMNIPGGDVSLGVNNLSVKSSGSIKSLDEIRNMVVNSHMGRLIYMRDIASIGYGYETQQYKARFGAKSIQRDSLEGGRCIFLGISQKQGLNVLETGEQLDPVIEALREELPTNMQLEVVYNQAQVVRERINGFMINLLQGIFLVGLVIFLSLGFRSSMMVVIAIPLSLIIGLGFVDMAGFGLEQTSIGGLVVALGLLVDNSIVMVENINRYIQLGHSRREASILAASEIGWPVVTATITTVLAFIPIAAMPGKTGEFIRSLPVTIALALIVSLFIALSFTPMLTSKLLKEKKAVEQKPRGFSGMLGWIIEHPFRSALASALKRPGISMLLVSVFLVISLAMFRKVGISFFPKAEQANLMIQASLPKGSSLERTDKVAHYLESVLDTMPEVRYYATNVGHGNPRIYYNVFPKRFDKSFTEIYVQLYDYDSEEFPEIIEHLRNEFDAYPGARISVKEFEQGPPFDAPVQIYLTGEDLEVLREISADVEGMLEEQPGAINIENKFVKTNTELLLNINKEKANMLGVPIVEIDKTIRTAVAGMTVSSFRDPSGEEHQVVLKMDRGGKFGEEELERIYVSSLSGKQHQLKQFVDIELQQAPSSISRYDMERTAEILADIKSGHSLDEVMDPILEKLELYPMPSGYSYTIAGELEGRSDAFGGVANAVLIAIISIFSVLVLQFRSFRQPLIVFLAIPFAVTGMIWALWITGNTFSFTAFIGLTSLVGIVVNNSIILVDYINKLRERGLALSEALQLAAETRLTPIVLTALTTIGGLLPLTLRGGTLWAPMGWTIIGGLLVSTVLTLVIVPVIYKLLERKKLDKAAV